MERGRHHYATLDLLEQGVGAAMRPVAADHVDLVHRVLQTPAENVLRVEPTARRAQEGAALVVNGVDHLGRQLDHALLRVRQRLREASVAVHHPIHARDAVETIATGEEARRRTAISQSRE